MKNYIKTHEWQIIEEGFDPHLNKISESLFSLGNGRFGQRGIFEETYSGETLQGNYVAGVYYPDKTRVGWWKNGYPEYFAKVLNAANWLGIDVEIEGEKLDLAKANISNFKRVLNMQEGYLQRTFTAKLQNGKEIAIDAIRFLSIADDETAAIRYSVKSINFSGSIKLTAFIDGDVQNQDSNYDEKFWNPISAQAEGNEAILTLETKKTAFVVSTGQKITVNSQVNFESQKQEKFVAQVFDVNVQQNQEAVITKYVSVVSSLNYNANELENACKEALKRAESLGFDVMKKAQADAWAVKWASGDITIEGDAAAAQGIRFNIFQLNQTYTGEDERLNIGPKGFTGEKYGGSTYWDTEAYCLPFYLSTADQLVARNLLIYRYKHLDKAIENAQKLGFKNGAALYPMVTINGEECHNEWEITFEEIHRNGAIAFAIYNYIRYTADADYLHEYGLEVLIAIARFWSQRITFSEDKQQYVMLGVTGPNEYENNVNNNWYTSYLACWCMEYAAGCAAFVKEENPARYREISEKINFQEAQETALWGKIYENMYLPKDKEQGIFLQQDGYLDKEQILVKDLDPKELPLNQKWSWDRILRSCYIKQADVLQGLYLFEDKFDLETIRKNFDFYEPRTVHESSLSPCVHAIQAAKLGDEQRAYQFYLRTSRLDLDDYNNDTEDGLHITSMAGTWMAVVEGFGGMRVKEGVLHFNPMLPEKWQSFAFNIGFRGQILKLKIAKGQISVQNLSDGEFTVYINDKTYEVGANNTINI